MEQPEEFLAELQRDKNLLQALVESTPEFFVVIGPEGRTRYMNPAMLQALGYRADQVLGMDYLETFVPYDDRAALQEVFDRIVREKKRTLNVNPLLTLEGDELLVEWHGTPVFDESGELEAFFGVGVDITELRVKEQRYAEREAFHGALLETIRDAVFLVGPDGTVVTASAAANRLLGLEEAAGLSAKFLGLPETTEPGVRTDRVELHHHDDFRIEVEVESRSLEVGDRPLVLYRVVSGG